MSARFRRLVGRTACGDIITQNIIYSNYYRTRQTGCTTGGLSDVDDDDGEEEEERVFTQRGSEGPIAGTGCQSPSA